MSRPREIKLAQGTVLLKNFPKEVAEALTLHIKDFEAKSTVAAVEPMEGSISTEETVAVMPEAVEVEATLTDTAIGVRVNEKNQWELVSVKYNANTKEAEVEIVENKDFRRDAITAFKMKANDLRFI